ncbi:hypothetical protein [Herbidospora daliensis]|uniref:hypothetical protein n=1 Tax=Herbidospora daliensis TaxID=295585 RepID=UPI0007801D26|nr:hypothetical protein [Herbidospora daliensis]
MDALFHVDTPPPPPAAPKESDGVSRTRRQREALAAGHHPLSLVLTRPLRLHDGAAPADDAHADGHRCGGCAHRTHAAHNGHRYPKCDIPGRFSNGAATDCRAWWPACVDYQPKEAQ